MTTDVRHRRPVLRRVVLGSVTVLAVGLLAFGYMLTKAFLEKPGNGPDAFRDRPASSSLTVVAGASTVQGTISADWVSGLYKPGTETVNAGINGHTTKDMLARLDRDVIELHPDRVIMLIGTNDIRGDLAPAASQANMAKMLDKLTTQTDAKVAVMSLQPLGEQINSDNNVRVRAYNAMLQQEAAKRGVDYLPLYENLVPLLGTDAPDFSFPILQTAFDKFILDKTFTEMSESHGLKVTVDNVHLNERGAGVAHRLAAEWLEKN
ncbi:SGNH/GDSL hydrolase family protein [Actinoplanes friuliensis]|uniref:G-D-S-L family lipolytic protein n=1 Tax=Actinoplanes friuliensis DSM 7358 TaxID=1246995 RepID=U5VZC0_9ACTN|nr:GDSL-type esterase/lipase family protein [Actinoplanes friuliensis]AGZ41031.1 G-D-S-L family lipolytic protein [Actinoplanes friuliensis DSM 7358]